VGKPTPGSVASIVFTVLGAAATAALGVFLWREGAFYLLPVSHRPMDPRFAVLRSSGTGGLSFGVVGTALVFLNLAYLIRRALIEWRWLGALRGWMSMHVFTGLVGGALVLLHSAFAPRSSLGTLAFVAMAVVLVTGLVGRYIYARVPRSIQGRELEVEEIRRGLADYQRQMEELGLRHEVFQRPLTADTVPEERGLAGSFLALLRGDAESREAYRALTEAVRSSDNLRSLRSELLPLARRYCRERHWFARYQELRRLMGAWRFLHRWFAILMLSAVAFHVWVALRHGRLWIMRIFF
jgi:hypothetical protein